MEFISNNGEVVEAKNKAAFCREYEISNSRSLNNASGALGIDGQRWKIYEEGVKFDKPKLYLGYYITTSKTTGRKEAVSRSETADKFMVSLATQEDPNAAPECREIAKGYVQHIWNSYEVIDNRYPDDVVEDVFGKMVTPYCGNGMRFTCVKHLSTANLYKEMAKERGCSMDDKLQFVKDFYGEGHPITNSLNSCK